MNEQGTDAWRTERAGKVTASVFRRVMESGRRAHLTLANEIMRDLRHVQAGEFATRLDDVPAIRWGREHEPQARAAYVMETGNLVETAPFVPHPTHPLIGASPDGFIGEDGLLEIKCPFGQRQHDRYRADGPGGATAQVQGQLWITGRAWCDFVSFDPRERPELQLVLHRIPRDEDYIRALAVKVTAFADEILAPLLEAEGEYVPELPARSADHPLHIDHAIDKMPNLF